ncbi:hypothetical protein ETD86_45380, partial [Nonomuraea turkmeniaca]
MTVTALRRGVSVLSEKPMSVTLVEARSMVNVADEARRLFAVNQNRRFMPGLVAFRRTVAELGPLGLMTSEFFMPYRGRGVPRHAGAPAGAGHGDPPVRRGAGGLRSRSGVRLLRVVPAWPPVARPSWGPVSGAG